MGSTTPLSNFSLRKCSAAVETHPANKLRHAKLVLQVQHLTVCWRESEIMVISGAFCSKSLDKNTVLGLNTKFCFMNTLITTDTVSEHFYFWTSSSQWIIHLLTYCWLLHRVWKQDGWIFSTSYVIVYFSAILYISRRSFSRFFWRKPL